ncbi:MAG: choice-of-anchor L domain-containing protein, partial [Bacteroidota bacterium]|nr:choice-of-anchor L domain-containing protein [Bacteroidota bacterium]
MKHQIVFVLLVLLCPFGLRAQVVIDQTFSIEEYVNDVLLGTGVTASNITYIGNPVQLAEVSDTLGLFSVESGLVLSSGDPNRLADCAADANPTGLSGAFSDADLLSVANSVPPLIGQSFTVGGVYDGCVLEFDFVAVGDSISFNYVFGSDEYLTYV